MVGGEGVVVMVYWTSLALSYHRKAFQKRICARLEEIRTSYSFPTDSRRGGCIPARIHRRRAARVHRAFRQCLRATNRARRYALAAMSSAAVVWIARGPASRLRK